MTFAEILHTVLDVALIVMLSIPIHLLKRHDRADSGQGTNDDGQDFN